jgi:uncharacterized protein (DUF433 family)
VQRKIVGEPIAGYPGLHMVERVDGRRAMLVGHRLRVSDIVRSVECEDGSEADVAYWLELDPGLVATVMRYYRDHRELVDGWIQAEDEYNERAEAEWRRKQGLELA